MQDAAWEFNKLYRRINQLQMHHLISQNVLFQTEVSEGVTKSIVSDSNLEKNGERQEPFL